ncbi:MAG: hypothetical protein A2430_00355 [Candidatus Liptonbacteria bacterium RIFOXYC1_FULL_36_8]|uniref:Peptidase M16 n=1 Tax=Candidatus Liptonbacteria bacterium RIFOXYC1_FULL_36_8 TaxID=1798655 RepID=A0A1G2CPD8_9BACT|nr:MAG: hypothetical protein A2430_00355 [Candidatus Liptonbacteria bacterium RIFOXYC1_FULL_36_8]
MFKKLTLKNGLRLILIPKKDAFTATTLILVEAGSKYETKEINGISHFLEHMCFKGTKKRPKALDISSELDSIGAEYNAFTGQEYTGYFAKVESSRILTALDVVSDIYVNPVFNQDEINKERGVIIEEINMYEDLPPRRVQELFMTLLYGDQPSGWDVAGRKEIIEKINQDDFLSYRSKHYVAEATIVVIAGNFNEDELVLNIREKFKGIEEGVKSKKIKTVELQDKPEVFIKNKESDQTHLVLGVRAFSLFDEKKHALSVLSDILGGGMSSRLFQKVREELGAAYYVRSEADLYTDHGILSASAGVDHRKIEKVISAIVAEFEKLTKEKVTSAELERAKEHIIGNLMISLETSDELASFYGGQEILKREMASPEELAQKIRKVTAEEIKSTAEFIFQNKKLNLAVIGPFKEEHREKLISLLDIK